MLIYSIAGLSRELNLSHSTLSKMRSEGKLPNGEFTDDKGTEYYSVTQLEELRKSLLKQYDKKAAAKAIGVSSSFFLRLLYEGRLPQPTHGIGTRRYYNTEDIKQLSTKLATIPILHFEHYADKAYRNGYYSLMKTATYFGISRATLQYWHRIKKLPMPSVVYNGHKYYTKAELDGFRENQLASYFIKREKRKKGKK